VVGVHVGLQRIFETEADLPQELHVALDLLDYRVDEHRLMTGVVSDQIGVG
jgi:hypothetical protein